MCRREGDFALVGAIAILDLDASGACPEAFNRALDELGYQDLKPRQGKQQDGKYHGIGIASFVKNTGRGPYEPARLVVSETGQVDVYLGITSMGPGHRDGR